MVSFLLGKRGFVSPGAFFSATRVATFASRLASLETGDSHGPVPALKRWFYDWTQELNEQDWQTIPRAQGVPTASKRRRWWVWERQELLSLVWSTAHTPQPPVLTFHFTWIPPRPGGVIHHGVTTVRRSGLEWLTGRWGRREREACHRDEAYCPTRGTERGKDAMSESLALCHSPDLTFNSFLTCGEFQVVSEAKRSPAGGTTRSWRQDITVQPQAHKSLSKPAGSWAWSGAIYISSSF